MVKTEAEVERHLKNGGEQVDAFYSWLRDEKKLSHKTADNHAFNAMRLVDYLANYPSKSVVEMNELDFREFFFSHSIRKLIGGMDAKRALPVSMSRFFEFLKSEELIEDNSWTLALIASEKKRYLRRLNEYESFDPDDPDLDDKFAEWCEEFTDDLYDRCLVPSSELLKGEYWGGYMGFKEFDLYEELTDHLLEYSKKIDHNNSMPMSEKRKMLNREQRRWLKKRRKDLDGKTPFEVVMDEREKLGEVLKGWEE